MGSTSNDVREKQKQKAQAEFEARKTALAEAGITGKALEKDPLYKKFRAEVKKANRRLAAGEARDAHVKKVAEEKAAKPKGPKGKKAAEQEQANKKGKKKAKKS